MRKVILLSSFFLSIQLSLGQQGNVVGKIDYTLPAGNSIWVPPFVAVDTFSGRIDEIIYNSGTDETFISLNTSSLPAVDSHYLEIGEGPEAGYALDILSSTGNGITIKGDVSALSITSAQKVIIREHLTLDGLLPEGANFSPFVDTFSLFNSDGTRLDVFWNSISGNWMNALGTVFDDQKIRPGQGVLLFLSEELTITLGGDGQYSHVKTTPTRTQVYGGGAVNLVGPVNPFPGTYEVSGIGFVADLAPFQDSVSFYSEDGLFVPTQTLLSDGGVTSGNDPVFINGLGQNSSTFEISHRQAAVVSVAAGKRISLTTTEIAP